MPTLPLNPLKNIMHRIILLKNISESEADLQVAASRTGAMVPLVTAAMAVSRFHSDDAIHVWQTHAFSGLDNSNIEYMNMGQFHETLVKQELSPLAKADSVFLVSADSLFHKELIDQINALSTNLVAISHNSTSASSSGKSPSQESSEQQIILLKLDQGAMDALEKKIFSLQHLPQSWDMSYLLDLLSDSGLTVTLVPGSLACTVMDEHFKLARFVLGTKAETLSRLQPMLRGASIPRLLCIKAEDWKDQPKTCLNVIQSAFLPGPLVVRSSSHMEDGWESSQAGAFDSILNVDSRITAELGAAIDKVLASYGNHLPESQILIQEMLLDVEMSGVLFTRSLGNGAPYYVINFDDQSGRTDSVTSGDSGGLRTTIIYRDAPNLTVKFDRRLIPLIESVREIEYLLDFDALDIEFVIAKSSLQVHILQVRPLTTRHPDQKSLDEEVRKQLDEAIHRLRSYQEKSPHITGSKTIFGVMPDANPAELIGTKPKPLAASLYRLLITEDVVAEERAKYGYIDVRPSPLMISIAGHPYIDVRTSFNSFTPDRLDRRIVEKLIDSYIHKLQNDLSLHDKVEFEIVFTCWFADLAQQVEARYPGVFTALEIASIEAAFAALTLKAIKSIDRDIAQVEEQKPLHREVVDAEISPLHKAVLLMQNTRRVGTGIFVRLARSGFVAITLLKSFVRCGYITQLEMDEFIASMNGVTSQLEELALAVKNGHLPVEELVKRCGHLRPGTYDITASAYFEDVGSFIMPMVENATARHKHTFAWREESRQAICQAFQKAGIVISFASFENFCRNAIEGREYSKFVYTNSLSYALQFLQEWGNRFGLTRDDLAYLEWNDFVNVRYGNIRADRENLSSLIEQSKRQYAIRETLELPILLSEERELFSFEKTVLEPNYITQKKILSEIVVVGGDNNPLSELKGKIVLIPRADPGYDWLFSQQIGGLITMYGGANSHMAIRSAELRLPAAIGVGEKTYSKLSQATTVSLNCEIRSINVIN